MLFRVRRNSHTEPNEQPGPNYFCLCPLDTLGPRDTRVIQHVEGEKLSNFILETREKGHSGKCDLFYNVPGFGLTSGDVSLSLFSFPLSVFLSQELVARWINHFHPEFSCCTTQRHTAFSNYPSFFVFIFSGVLTKNTHGGSP